MPYATFPIARLGPRVARSAPPDHIDTADPLVSVILPTYNGSSRGYLGTAIESVTAQTYRNRELIIVNDGSTDATGVFLQGYDRPGIRIIDQCNLGLAAARNTGVMHAAGDYLCFIDDDDLWMPDKLERQLRFFQQMERRTSGRTKMVFTNITLIDERGQVIGRQAHHADGDIYGRLFVQNIIDSPSAVMLRRDVLDVVGPFDPTLRSIEDLDLWLRIAQHHEIYSLDEPLVLYRVHANKMSAQLDTMYRHRRLVIKRAIEDNRRPDVRVNPDNVFFEIEKQYFEKNLEINNRIGVRRHFRQSWLHQPWRTLGNIKMWIKMLLSAAGLGGLFVVNRWRTVKPRAEQA